MGAAKGLLIGSYDGDASGQDGWVADCEGLGAGVVDKDGVARKDGEVAYELGE